MTSLKNFLTGSIAYDTQWGVWAKKVDGKFDLDAEARFGQFVFENGGILDDFECVGNNEAICYQRDEYCGSDEDCTLFYEEWAEGFIHGLNQ